MRVALYTLGCKVNHYETEAMAELFRNAGWQVVPFTQEAEVYLVNTCTVTATGDAKSRQILSRAHKRNPSALVVAVGCYAQLEPEAVAALPGVGLVVGTDGRQAIVGLVTDAWEEASRKREQKDCDQPKCDLEVENDSVDTSSESGLRESSFSTSCGRGKSSPRPGGEETVQRRQTARAFEPLTAVRDGRTRATLKIQDGCANFCSYCIIPFARGPLRSRPLGDVEEELRLLSEEGYLEVVLTGIHLASYGKDLGNCDLMDVLALTERIPGIRRVRLGSLEPKFVDERFAQAAGENSKLCRQFHLSLQSGSDGVLKRMNRRYTTEEYARAVEGLNRAMPDCAVTTDVIAGFCGETEEEHRETMAFCREMGFARMHVFPFSLRPGTKAALMDGQLQKGVKEARAKELIGLGKELTDAFLSRQVGTVQEVLLESGGEGYTGNYVRVRCPGREGKIMKTRILSLDGETAIGKEI